MDAATELRHARRKAGLTQRALAEVTGVPQPAIARIESGAVVPRVDSLDRLLRGCGETLEARPLLGGGVDRSLITRLRGLSAREQLELAALEARNLDRFVQAAG
jgi:predicted transcriptional regulator